MTLNIPLLVFILSCAPCIASNNGLEPRAACDKTYTTCSPKGAATSSEPPLGTGLASIFVAIVETVDGAHNEKRDVQPEAGVLLPRAQGGSLCC